MAAYDNRSAMTRLFAAGIAALLLSPSTPALAEFTLKDKTVTVIVSGGVGGGLDSYTRVFLKYFTKYLPGNPAMIVQNMPGAGGVQGVARLFTIPNKDGTAIATTPAGPVKEPLMGRGSVPYDLRQFRWVGSLTLEDTTCLVWHTSDIKTLDDAKKREVPLSATGTASNSTLGPLLLNALLGTKFKPISGYDGGTSMLAIEREEMEGRCTTLNSIRTTKPDWIRDKLMRPLVMMSDIDAPEFPGVPKVKDLLKTESDKQAFAFFQAADEVQDPIMLPPGTPNEVVDGYRKAFDAAVKDPEYMTEAVQRQQNVIPSNGAKVQAKIEAMYATPPDVIERVKKATALAN
jgi:tripartite-type tricarboxylate transporter receptor subunit TctC